MIDYLYLANLPPYWDDLAALVAALGCTVTYGRLTGEVRGDPPTHAHLYSGGFIRVPHFSNLSAQCWAYIAHEAAHHYAGDWSLEDEHPMLPFELGLLRRVANPAQRRECMRFMSFTGLGGIDLIDFVEMHGPKWTSTDAWLALEGEAVARGLTLDGTIP